MTECAQVKRSKRHNIDNLECLFIISLGGRYNARRPETRPQNDDRKPIRQHDFSSMPIGKLFLDFKNNVDWDFQTIIIPPDI